MARLAVRRPDRRLLVLGATVVIRHVWTRATPPAAWITRLLERRPAKLVAVALTNKTARITWAVLVRGAALPRLGVASGGVRRRYPISERSR